ncbi:MAG: lipoyl synthase [Deltaproteobacteria bacterium]|nr:lipoyl synthase [Deltaproteobacteria bacterium]
MEYLSDGNLRLPKWAKRKIGTRGSIHKMKEVLRREGLHTVCEEASCPNMGECFSKPTATFMIMGDLCTRNCGFCDVTPGIPKILDIEEPMKVARASKQLGLRHVVITSVTRDDLYDGGARHFGSTIKELKNAIPEASIEVLTPDFKGDVTLLEPIARERPDIFNHNMETVPRLYPLVRPQADYERSLKILKGMKAVEPEIVTKSGIMLGLGEKREEILGVMDDLRTVGCDLLTIGQYLRPSKGNLPVVEYVEEELFAEYGDIARKKGFLHVASAPLVRSSFNAEEIWNLKAANHRDHRDKF